METEIKETVYEHESGKDTFTITAAERWSVSMVRKLREKHPEEVQIVAENSDGTLLARMPYSWMRITPKRKVNMSEEQRAAAAQRLKAAKEANTDS